MSLFGSLIPLRQPFTKIPEDVKPILERALEYAGMKSEDDRMHCEMLKDLYGRLEVIMFFEILTYLPGKHLAMFVKMNDEGRPRGILDTFLQENMPNAEKVFDGALAKFREYYARVGEHRNI